ncbi:reverse transcriptase [Tanacetum coccineum]
MAEVSMKRRGLRDSPADNHEDPKLERPGTGQSLDDSSPSRTSEDFNFLVVNPVRRAGGLMLCWNKDLNVQITSFSKHHVNFSVIEDTGREWRGSGIYGWPTNQDKYHTWMLLRSIKSLSTLPWVCFGDFNKVLYSFEKVGARGCNMRELEAFAASCQDCNLYDLRYRGTSMTWSNRRRGTTNVQKRLDRFFATSDWVFSLHFKLVGSKIFL